jgi:ATP-binding cassette subfamily F protein 3
VTEREKQRQAYSNQQEEIARLRGAVGHLSGLATYKRGGKADSDKFAKGFYKTRSARTIGRAKQLERRIEQLMGEDRIDKPGRSWQLDIDFGEVPSSGQDVLIQEDLAVGYGEKVLLRGMDHTIRAGERVVLVGPNGAGKTTLLRTAAGLLEPLAGRVRLGANVRMGYMAQEQEELDPSLDAFSTIRRTAPFSETDARSFLHHFLFSGDDVFTPVGMLSYGERSRLALARFVAQGCNFLMLDEPINHLDIPSRARFEQAMTHFDGTILAVTHDRYFIEGFATHIWEIEGDGLRSYVK